MISSTGCTPKSNVAPHVQQQNRARDEQLCLFHLAESGVSPISACKPMISYKSLFKKSLRSCIQKLDIQHLNKMIWGEKKYFTRDTGMKLKHIMGLYQNDHLCSQNASIQVGVMDLIHIFLAKWFALE